MTYNTYKGPVWIIAGSFGGAWAATAIRALSEFHASPQLIFLCFLLGFPVFLPWIMARKDALRTRRMRLYTIRSMLEVAGWYLAFTAITQMPLPAWSALTFMTPLILSTAAVILLGERTTIHTWIALFTGIAGILTITRPGADLFNEGAAYMVAACSCFAACGVIIKKLSAQEPVPRITAFMFLLTPIFTTPFAFTDWTPLQLSVWYWYAIMGVGTLMQQYCITQALSISHVTRIVPFGFMHIVFTSTIAWLLFDEIISPWTLTGAVIIFSSALYALYHNRKLPQVWE